jgi:hypothetical protein
MPLRHIGSIVIWEGNYIPDIKSIGNKSIFHEEYFREKGKMKNEKGKGKRGE